MNKLFTKIATFAIGAFMAVGVGVAATLSGSEPIEARAATGDVVDEMQVKNWTGAPSSYTTDGTEYSHSGPNSAVLYSATGINSSGNIRGNRNANTGNFNLRNTTTKNGYYLSKLVITCTGGTMDPSTTNRSVLFVGTSVFSEITSSTVPSGTKITAAETAAGTTLTFVNTDTSISYFQFYSLKTSGTCSNGTIKITWSSISGGGAGGDIETPTPVLSGISLSGQQTEFTVGDTFVFGGTVTANYSGKDPEDVTNDATFSGYDMSTAGTQTVTVTYTYEGKTVTAEYEITVKESLPEGYFDRTINIASYASSNGWKDATQYSTILSEPFTITATGGQNTGKYYGGSNWRIYQNENPSLTIKADVGYNIASVKVSYEIGNTGILTHNDSHVTSDTTVNVNADSVTFSVGNTDTATNGQVRVTEIYIIYTEVSVEIVPFTSISISDENLELNIGAEHTLTWETVGGSNDTVLWESSAEGVATVSSGVVTAVGVGEATITAKSKADPNKFDTVTVNVEPASPTEIKISKQNKEFVIGKTIGYHFTSEQNVITVTYSDNREPVLPLISDERLTLTVGEQEVTSETIVTSELLEGKTIGVKFTDENGKSITHGSGLTNIQTIDGVAITGETRNFVGGVDYLMVEDADSDLVIEYTSHFGALDLENEVLFESSNEEVLAAEIDLSSGIFEGTSGSFTLDLLALAEGQASLYIYVLKAEVEIEYHSNPILVRSSAPSSGSSDQFVKITNVDGITIDAKYLIVYENESGSLAFDGSLGTTDSPIDATSNYKAVTLLDNETIEATAELKGSTFTILANNTNYTVKSASGYYIGQTSNANGLKSSDSTTYENTITFNDDGSVNFVSGGAYLRYNGTSGQERFRYYKSSSYTAQNAIHLYKLVEGSSSLTTDFDYAYEFVQTYMHTEIKIDVEGTGRCVSEGWYVAAKAAFFDGTDGEFHLNRDQRNIVATSFNDYFVRLQNWAVANGETIELVGDDYQVSPLRSPLLRVSNTDSNATIIIISISSILALATFIVVKKRRSLSK